MLTELSPNLGNVSKAKRLRFALTAQNSALATSKPVGGLHKRCFDVCVALLALIALSPLFVLVALAVKASDRGPIFFRHRRVGNNGEPFDCLKFRTMRPDGDSVLEQHLRSSPAARDEYAATRKLKNDPRVTAIGVFLRKASLDELPQILNILSGEMSLVGPRPIVTAEIAMYGSDAQHYLATRPGLTGAWQVSGRNDVSYEERVRLDRGYVENWSFVTDLVIIVRTVPAVFMSRGSY
ncbi:MAG: sugar transferase [Methylobacterium sp.]